MSSPRAPSSVSRYRPSANRLRSRSGPGSPRPAAAGVFEIGRAIEREHVPEGQDPTGLPGYGDLKGRVPDGIDEGASEPAGRLRASLPRSHPRLAIVVSSATEQHEGQGEEADHGHDHQGDEASPPNARSARSRPRCRSA